MRVLQVFMHIMKQKLVFNKIKIKQHTDSDAVDNRIITIDTP